MSKPITFEVGFDEEGCVVEQRDQFETKIVFFNLDEATARKIAAACQEYFDLVWSASMPNPDAIADKVTSYVERLLGASHG